MAKHDLTGIKFGKLTVLRQGPHSGKFLKWYCICECGNESLVFASALRTGITKSCGCLRGEKHGESNFYKRGHRKESKEYKSWCHIKQRCFNPNSKSFKHYGARGITMCDEWKNSYSAFLDSVGRCPSDKVSIDRIDNLGNYAPGNCKWSNYSEQNKNRRPFKKK